MSYIQQSNMAMENGPFIDIGMVIFHGYVSLPVYQRVTNNHQRIWRIVHPLHL